MTHIEYTVHFDPTCSSGRYVLRHNYCLDGLSQNILTLYYRTLEEALSAVYVAIGQKEVQIINTFKTVEASNG